MKLTPRTFANAVALFLVIAIALSLFVLIAHAATAVQPQNGGTGLTAQPTYGQVLVGNGSGGYALTATSSLGISASGSTFSTTSAAYWLTQQTTSDLSEGSNLYYTAARALVDFVKNLAATTSVASITTLPHLSLPYVQLTGTPTIPSLLSQLDNDTGFVTSSFSTTSANYWLTQQTTAGLAEGSNLYFTNARADTRFVTDLAATTSVKSIVTLPGLSLPYTQLTGTPTIPTETSQLTNNSGFITGVTWGDITGTLGDQSDLQTALDAKQETLTLTTSGSSGAATLSDGTLNIPQYAGTTYTGTYPIIVSGGAVSTAISTSTLLSLKDWFSTTTDQLKEGTANLYFTNARADARFVAGLAATSSVKSITTLPSLSLPYSQLTGTPAISGYPFPSNATSTKLDFSGGIQMGTLSGFVGANNGTLYSFASSSLNAASSTLLGDANTFSGVDIFGNASSNFAGTWQGLSPSDFADFGYPFPLGATSSPLLLLASTTIGGGGQATGLTISGGATTTGNSYFASHASVGTTSTDAILTIQGTTQNELELAESSTGSAAQIVFENRTRTWELGADASPDLFYIETPSGGSQTTFDITATGNVGINTKSPQTALDVLGEASSTNDLVASLATPAGTFVAADATGKLIATTTPGLAFGYPFPTNATTSALTVGGLTLSNITGSTQCLHVNSSGVISGTASDCGTGSGGVTSIAATYPLQTTGSTGAITISTAISTSTLLSLAAWFATTTAPQLTSLPNLSLAYSQLTGTPAIPSKTSDLTNDSGFITDLSSFDTDDLTEGSSNLYFTNSRADARFVADLAATTSVKSITTLASLSLPYSQLTGTPTIPTNNNQLTNGAGYITSYTETDPVVAAITGIVKSNGSTISAATNGTDYTLLTATTCTSGDFVSALTAAGAVTCSTPSGGSSFDYPFPSNATTTALTLSGGIGLSGVQALWFNGLGDGNWTLGMDSNSNIDWYQSGSPGNRYWYFLNHDDQTTPDFAINSFYGFAYSRAGFTTGQATTSPFAALSVINGSNSNYPVAFYVGSSTAAFATSTLFAIDKSGTITTKLSTGLVKSNSGTLGLATAGTDYLTGSGTSGHCAQWGSSNTLTDAGAACGSGGGGNISGWATSTPFGSQLLLYPTDGTEDVAFGGTGSAATTTAPFWWDVSATTTYIGNGGTGDSFVTLGATNHEWTLGADATDNSFAIASSTALGTTNFLTFTKAGGYQLNQLASNGLLQINGTNLSTLSTTTASCSGIVSCTTFVILGSSPITISGSGGGAGNVSTSTSETAGQLAYWTSTSATPATLGKVATGTVAAGTGISVTSGQAIIGSGLTITNSGVISLSCTTVTCSGTNPATLSIASGAISNSQLANSTISGISLGSNLANLTATNGTLTFSGTYNGGAARTIGLNLANANTWTATSTFTPGLIVGSAGAIFSNSGTTTIQDTNGESIGNGSHGIYIVPGSSTTTIQFY